MSSHSSARNADGTAVAANLVLNLTAIATAATVSQLTRRSKNLSARRGAQSITFSDLGLDRT